MSTTSKIQSQAQGLGSHSLENMNQGLTLATSDYDPLADLSNKDWLNTYEAALYLGKSKQTLYNWIHLGTGPRRKKEYGRWYFNRKDLDAHRKANTESFEAFR